MTSDDPLTQALNARLVYHLPNEDNVRVLKDVPFKTIDDLSLRCDIYIPNILSPSEVRPAIVFVSGDTPPEYMLTVKEWGIYTGWGRLVAAAGFVGITFQHRVMHELQVTHLDEVVADVADVIAFVRRQAADFQIDPDRLCLWCGSAGATPGLHVGLRDGQPFIRCLISYYGLFDLALYARARQLDVPPADVLQRFAPVTAFSQRKNALPPLLIARMGQDIPGLNEAVDQFIMVAEQVGASVEVLHYPEGHHGFDIEDDTDQSRTIIQQTLAFMHRYLDS